jgi:hypothetical protein
VADKNRAEMITGRTAQADLIIYMEAKDFNDLMLSMATGKADESTFRRLVVSKFIRFAGDMTVFELLFKDQKRGSSQ